MTLKEWMSADLISTISIWAFRLEDSPSGYPLQVLARSSLWAFRFYPSRADAPARNQIGP